MAIYNAEMVFYWVFKTIGSKDALAKATGKYLRRVLKIR